MCNILIVVIRKILTRVPNATVLLHGQGEGR